MRLDEINPEEERCLWGGALFLTIPQAVGWKKTPDFILKHLSS